MIKNFKVTAKEDNKEYWISRSIAVAAFIYLYDPENEKTYVLANKRGCGTPDFQGYWNCPCGYLDFDEDLLDAAVREIAEECGYIIKKDNLNIIGINSDPKDSNNQNVTVRFTNKNFYLKKDLAEMKINNTDKNNFVGEKNEVSEVKWIDIENIDNYQWAFNHDELILQYA